MATMDADRESARPPLVEVIAQLGVAEEPQNVADYLSLIEFASDIESQAHTVLREAVGAARAAGATWSAIGAVLGMSKQAAQQRFTTGTPTAPIAGPDERILGPVTTFDEMDELALAGQYGWHSVEVGTRYHRVLRSDTRWEHSRVTLLGGSRRSALQAEGWQVIHASFPYTYLKRDLGTPALVE